MFSNRLAGRLLQTAAIYQNKGTFTGLSFGWSIWGHTMFLSALVNVITSLSIIETLPGFSGTMPSKFETGYISVGDLDEVQLFYYFFESEGNPKNDPLVLWFTGGPGCSGLSVFAENKGPLVFDVRSFSSGSLPTLLKNPYTFVKVANIIFIDAPAHVGFSYATVKEGYYSSDTKITNDASIFLRKWLLDHPEFHKNPLYIGGDSYAGMFVAMLMAHVSKDIEAGRMPNTNLQGYVIGNPLIDTLSPWESRVSYAYQMALVSSEYFESARSSCHGDYNIENSSKKCLHDLQIIDKCMNNINEFNILDPKCGLEKRDELQTNQKLSAELILLPTQKDEQSKPCLQDITDMIITKWANDPVVQQALNVRNGTLSSAWTRCNTTWSGFVQDVTNAMEYHRDLSKKGYRALIYSGDHDMNIPYIDTLGWIRKLNLSFEEQWRPWFVDHQVAGYTEMYRGKNGFSLTFATVKGAGHVATVYKPKEVFAMVDRWFSHTPL